MDIMLFSHLAIEATFLALAYLACELHSKLQLMWLENPTFFEASFL